MAAGSWASTRCRSVDAMVARSPVVRGFEPKWGRARVGARWPGSAGDPAAERRGQCEGARSASELDHDSLAGLVVPNDRHDILHRVDLALVDAFDDVADPHAGERG